MGLFFYLFFVFDYLQTGTASTTPDSLTLSGPADDGSGGLHAGYTVLAVLATFLAIVLPAFWSPSLSGYAT